MTPCPSITTNEMHPDFVVHSPSGHTVIVMHPNETHSVLDLLLMSELEVRAANGHTK